jgi:hypothetical protein
MVLELRVTQAANKERPPFAALSRKKFGALWVFRASGYFGPLDGL